MDAPVPSDLGSGTDAPAPDAPTGDLGVDASGPTDAPTGDVPTADVPVVDIPPVDAGPACPAVPIGAGGGMVTCGGATLVVPPGALSTTVPLQIVPTGVAAPSGYTGYSRIFRFEPAGTAFSMPVQVSIPFTGDAARATLFWSRPTGSTGYERIGGLAAGTTLSGRITHFSSGFVADGVEYSEPADRSCTVTRLLEGRTVSPSGIAMFFSAEDCLGNPLTDLAATDFVVNEDGTRLSSESSATLLTRVGPQVFVSLVLDLSSSTSPFLPQLIAAAGQFVTTLQTVRRLPVQIGLQVFAGEASLTEWQAPTLDTARLLARLEALSTYRPADPSSTNLYGAVVSALSRQATAQATFRARNAGGAFTSGYVVLFTDGGDTSGLTTQAQARAALRDSPDRVLAVGLAGDDYMPSVLNALAPGGVLETPSTTTLTREFNTLAARIAAQFRTSYLLGYCSPRRTGMHTVTVGVAGGGTTMPVATYSFSAAGFGPGCSAVTFTGACAAADQCGGLGCGACDDRTSLCNGTTRECVNHCVAQRQCGGTVIVNPLGYSQMCADRTEATSCGGVCRDIQTDLANCGGCGRTCAGAGVRCVSGSCVCPETQRECSGVCRNILGDPTNCGGCGNRCASGASCVAGTCTCPVSDPLACMGACVPSNASNCGACGQLCPISCSSGACVTVTKMAAGHLHTCARFMNGDVQCWGNNQYGQLGNGLAGDRYVPTAVPGLSNVIDIAAGLYHTCARLMDGSVRCWGGNATGQLGDGTTTQRLAPTAVTGLSNAVEIAAGTDHTCARLMDGTVRCWGNNEYGQLGDGTTTRRLAPIAVTGLNNVVEIAAGRAHTCARVMDGSVHCWGYSLDGQLGDGTTTQRFTPGAVTGLSNVVEIAIGGYGMHTCARLIDGSVRCWGLNESGELGDGTMTRRFTPTVVLGLSSVVEITAGRSHTCARVMDGSVRCWGADGVNAPRLIPTMVAGISGAVEIAVGTGNSCVRLMDNSIRCWGHNRWGSVGDGTTTTRPSPTAVRF